MLEIYYGMFALAQVDLKAAFLLSKYGMAKFHIFNYIHYPVSAFWHS